MKTIHKKIDEDYLSDLYRTRAQNLCLIAERLKSDKALAKEIGMTSQNTHKLIRRRDIPFTEKMARAIEFRLGLPIGHLDSNKEKNVLPIYLIEHSYNLKKTQPVSDIYYKTSIENAFFVFIANSFYEPIIPIRSKILIDPNKKNSKNNRLYLISHALEAQIFYPTIKKFYNNEWYNIVNNNKENLLNVSIIGQCCTIIYNFEYHSNDSIKNNQKLISEFNNLEIKID